LLRKKSQITTKSENRREEQVLPGGDWYQWVGEGKRSEKSMRGLI
jgi:U3 small nucleolar RNA-associated protein 14